MTSKSLRGCLCRIIIAWSLMICLAAPADAATFETSNTNFNNSFGTSLTVDLTTVASGSLIVVGIGFDSAADATASVGDGTDTLTALTQITAQGENVQLFYILSSNATGTVTYTFTGASRAGRRIAAWEYSYTGTAAFDVEDDGNAAIGTLVTTGDFTTAGTDEVVVAIYHEVSGTVPSDFQINDAAADESEVIATFSATWGSVLTATMTNDAKCTLDSSAGWVVTVAAFDITAAGGGLLPRLMLLGIASVVPFPPAWWLYRRKNSQLRRAA